MADELLRRRKQINNDIEKRLKSEKRNYTDRDIEKIRLKYANDCIGPTQWTRYTTAIETNDLTPAQQSTLKRDITSTKVELKKTIDESGNSKIARKPGQGKYPVILAAADDDDLPKNMQIDKNMPLAKQAQLNYQYRVMQQRQAAADNRLFNKYISHHIHGTTTESRLQEETFNEMCESSVDGRIESQQDYLREGHAKLHESNEYQQIIARRKNIVLCKDTEGSLNDAEQRKISDLIDDNNIKYQ